MRVLALTKYGMRAASARQRFGLYEPSFAEAGIALDFAPLLPDSHVANLSAGRRTSPWTIAAAYGRRARALLTAARRADVLWVHCETFPFLPAWVERLTLLTGRPVVFDYDDAIFHMYDDSPSAAVRTLLGGKLRPLIAGAAAVTAGNEYVADYARRLNNRVLVVPTVVDTDRVRPSPHPRSSLPVIGWIGSPSTWPYVEPLLPILRQLAADGLARTLIVGAGRAAERLASAGVEFRPWAEQREISDLQEMDIGIMPVPDAAWERGKSGFKLIQYMAIGIPSIASPVGVNAAVLADGQAGITATSAAEWEASLRALLADGERRRRLGAAARTLAVENYSLTAQAPRLIELFRSLGTPST